MFTQIKLSDGNIWHAEQDPNDPQCFRLVKSEHNSNIWRHTDTQFCSGMSVLRSKVVIMGFVYEPAEKLEISRINQRKAERRLETRREKEMFTISAVAKVDWSRLANVL